MGKTEKIGILTFHASHNYGSMLQAYALQAHLQASGYDAQIVNLRIPAQKHCLYRDPLRLSAWRLLINFFSNPFAFCGKVVRWRIFEKFLREKMNLSQECGGLRDVDKCLKDNSYDTIILGGDQIWNADCLDFSLAYYMPFHLPGVKIVSYAPSFGGDLTFLSPDYRRFIRPLMERIDFISVRDKAGSEMLSALLGKEVPSMTDPTMLQSREFYDDLAGGKPVVRGRYMYYYNPSNRKLDLAQKIADRSNIRMVTHWMSGPCEFLNLVKNAEFVCGTSFHLVIFALVFHKKFISIGGDSDARIMSILEDFHLQRCACPSDADPDSIELQEIDWDAVDSVLAEYRKKGCDFLCEALG